MVRACRYIRRMATVVRTHHELGRRGALSTLQQSFRFGGDDVSPAAIDNILMSAPLTGDDSIFGSRPGDETEGPSGSTRTLRGFSPVPTFVFDVHLDRRSEGLFVVRFSQPARDSPYLQGEMVWFITEQSDGVEFSEEVNTEQAMEVASEPLTGPRPSLRRWLFFRTGHKQVMNGSTANIAGLLSTIGT